LQPRYGTVEVRIMDAQTTVGDVAALAALIQALATHELEHPDADLAALPDDLLLDDRFRAARDATGALLIDPRSGRRAPATAQLQRLLAALRHPARRLRCQRELAAVQRLIDANGATRQRAHARHGDPQRVTAHLAHAYPPPTTARPAIAATGR